MFKKFKKILAIFIFFGLLTGPDKLWADDSQIAFSSSDRILVIAPHPDDESLGLGGTLQRAVSAGAQVKVLYVTNGELNEVASIFYRKRPLFLKSDFIKNGLIRKKESINAMGMLGIGEDNLTFLGYPDGGMLGIWVKCWGKSKPFRSFFTRLNKVPYKESLSLGNYYRGDEVVRDFEKAILSFQPTHVFVTAPFDLNQDHQATYLYFQVALMNLNDQLNPVPQVHLYVIHAHQWPKDKKFLPNEELSIPKHIDWKTDVNWDAFSLSSEETAKKSDAILKYKSQISYNRNFLMSFARKNELFADYPQEMVKPVHTEQAASRPGHEKAGQPGDVTYEIDDKFLIIKVPFSSSLDEMGLLTAYVFSYRKGFMFSDMPKFTFKLFGNKMFVRDGSKSFYDRELIYLIEKNRVLIRIPLKDLKDPDFLFVSTRNAKEDMTLDFGSWRLLEVSKSPGNPNKALL